MQKNLLQLDQSGWWVLLILLVALVFTWFLYSVKKTPWSKVQNWTLSTLRFLAVFLILSLLLEPFINQAITRIEKPIVAIAIDNSQSVVARVQDSTAVTLQVNELREQLAQQGIETKTFYLNEMDSQSFSNPTTNLSELQGKIDNEMEGRNWVASFLFSDGVFNQGSSPIYRPYPVPQFTVGLGDTIPPKDINISRVLYNRVSFKGNETPIRVEVTQKGFNGQTILLTLRENGKRIDQKTVRLTKAIQEIEFLVKSEDEGLRKMDISLPLQQDEFVKENNSSKIFMEVIDGRQKVLIVAASPHPDIKAIRSALASTDNYETDLYIPALKEDAPEKIYDVVIYHGAFAGDVTYEPKESPGKWYILNQRSSLNAFKKEVPFFAIQRRSTQPDAVTGSFNQSFSKFNLPESQRLFEGLPPISVPFGEYALSGPVEVLLFQRVGSIITKKPLFAFYDDGSQKSAVLAGQDIWKWKLQEAALNGNSNQFQELVTKTVQFLSVKNDKKQFRFRSRGSNFSDIASITFDSEVYNDSYERTYGNKILLKVTDDQGQSKDFEFTDSEFNSSFKVPPLGSGIYFYTASVKLGADTFLDKGQFLVEEINREYLNLTANHNILKTLSKKTTGEFFPFSNVSEISDVVRNRDFKNLIRSSESYFPLLQSSWMLLLILLLLSSEWVLRKYWGGY